MCKKWRNGIYRGSCKNNIQHGKGTLIKDGKKYTGNWRGNILTLNKGKTQNKWWHKLYSYLQNLSRSTVKL